MMDPCRSSVARCGVPSPCTPDRDSRRARATETGCSLRSARPLAQPCESHGDVTEALSWYERAQKQAPNGVYAAEACAGKMRMLLQTGGPTAARPAAELYL